MNTSNQFQLRDREKFELEQPMIATTTNTDVILNIQNLELPANQQIQLNETSYHNSTNNQQNLSQELRQSINNAILINILFAFTSLVKILTSSIILIYSTTPICNEKLAKWLIFMIIHDTLYGSLKLIIIRQIIKINYAQEEFFLNVNDGMISAQNQISSSNITEKILKKNKYIGCLAEVCRAYYLFLMVYVQFLYYENDYYCNGESSPISTLIFIYIIISYIYFGIPITILILTCLCLPVIILWVCIHARGTQAPARKVDIEKLQVIKFDKTLPGTHECSICMQDYMPNEDIIQLKCSTLHHYHAQCLKKWLAVNGLCPICRTRIDA